MTRPARTCPASRRRIERPRAVTVRFLNEAGEIEEERDFVHLWATSVQHQIDHLAGGCISTASAPEAQDAAGARRQDRALGGHEGRLHGHARLLGPGAGRAGAAGTRIAAVYCQPPRPPAAARSPAPARCRRGPRRWACRSATRQPEGRGGTGRFAALGADVAVVVAYGLILPQPVLDAPRAGCLNIHASLLPRWRGAAPIHRAIMAGDAETGVCIMQMEAGLDTGPVLLREATPIGPEDTTGDLHDRLAAMGARLIVEALEPRLPDLTPRPQPEAASPTPPRSTRPRRGSTGPAPRGGRRADPRPLALSRRLGTPAPWPAGSGSAPPAPAR
jgi:hypothetical protein